MNRIREYRKASNLSQEKLGKLVGVSARSIGFYETGGRAMTVQTAVDIAKALDTTLNELFMPSTEQIEHKTI